MYNEGMKLIVFTSDLKTVLVILMDESLTREPPQIFGFSQGSACPETCNASPELS